MVKLKYRNGVPTKKSLKEFAEEFCWDFKFIRFGYNYGNQKPNEDVNIIWQRNSIQLKMDEFIDYASDAGIVFGKYTPYESPRVGSLVIKNRNNL